MLTKSKTSSSQALEETLGKRLNASGPPPPERLGGWGEQLSRDGPALEPSSPAVRQGGTWGAIRVPTMSSREGMGETHSINRQTLLFQERKYAMTPELHPAPHVHSWGHSACTPKLQLHTQPAHSTIWPPLSRRRVHRRHSPSPGGPQGRGSHRSCKWHRGYWKRKCQDLCP